MNKYHKIMEKFWLLIAVVSFVYAVYKFGQVGLSEAATFFLFPFIAAALFFSRYYVRKRSERADKDSDAE